MNFFALIKRISRLIAVFSMQFFFISQCAGFETDTLVGYGKNNFNDILSPEINLGKSEIQKIYAEFFPDLSKLGIFLRAGEHSLRSIDAEEVIYHILKSQIIGEITVTMTADNGNSVTIDIPDLAKIEDKQVVQAIMRCYIAKGYAAPVAMGNGPCQALFISVRDEGGSSLGDIEKELINSIDTYFKESGYRFLNKANKGNNIEIKSMPADFKPRAQFGLMQMLKREYAGTNFIQRKDIDDLVTIGFDAGGQGTKVSVRRGEKDITDSVFPPQDDAREEILRQQDRSLTYRYSYQYGCLKQGGNGEQLRRRWVEFVEQVVNAVEKAQGKVDAVFIGIAGVVNYEENRMESLGNLSRGFKARTAIAHAETKLGESLYTELRNKQILQEDSDIAGFVYFCPVEKEAEGENEESKFRNFLRKQLVSEENAEVIINFWKEIKQDYRVDFDRVNQFIPELITKLKEKEIIFAYAGDMPGWGTSIAYEAGLKNTVAIIQGSGIGTILVRNGRTLVSLNEGGHFVWDLGEKAEPLTPDSIPGEFEDWAGGVRGILGEADKIGLIAELKNLGINEVIVKHIGLAACGINPFTGKDDLPQQIKELALQVWDTIEQRNAEQVIRFYRITGETNFAFGGGTTVQGTGEIRRKLLQKYVDEYCRKLGITKKLTIILLKETQANPARGAALKAQMVVQDSVNAFRENSSGVGLLPAGEKQFESGSVFAAEALITQSI